MQLSFVAPSAVKSGVWVVGAVEGPALLPAAERADKACSGAIGRALAVSQFTGKSGQVLELLAPAGIKASRLLVVGLGKPEDFDANRAEAAAAAAIGRLSGTTEAEIAFEIDAPKGGKARGAKLAAHLALGARLRTYAFNHYRTKDLAEHESKLKKVTVFTTDPDAARKAWRPCEAVADSVFLARDLVNEPPNVLSPVGIRPPRQGAFQARAEGGGAGRGADEEARHGRASGRGPGQRAGKPACGPAMAWREEEGRLAGRFRRQGRLLRFRRPLAQASPPA